MNCAAVGESLGRAQMPPHRDDIAGLILIGGKSERMQRPKATVPLAGIPLWRHVVNILEPVVKEVVFLGAVTGFAPSGFRQLSDDPSGIGPMGGLIAGLEQSGFAHHLLLAVDYPLVRKEFLELLLEQSEGSLAVCGQSGTVLEPMVAYYHRDCAGELRQMVSQGDLRVHGLINRVPSRVLGEEEIAKIDPAKWSLFNVNTPTDLFEAETRLRSGYPS